MKESQERRWTAPELRELTAQMADRWRRSCRNFPLVLRIIDEFEALFLNLINLVIKAQRTTYPSRYDHLVSDKELIDRPS